MIDRHTFTFSIALAALALPLDGAAAAQVPSFAEVTGHEFGGRITSHSEMVRYVERLSEASPRVHVVELGQSWEGRKFVLAIVTSPDNHARLDEIRAAAQRLADPRATTGDEASQIIAGQPVIVWLGGSIHGFELSGSEGLLKLLEHLSLRDDAATREILENAVVLIDPMLNPDGRDAFVHINHENIGRVANPERDDWSNDYTSWQALKFRTGHYYFDNNRDWFAHTQPAARAHAGSIQNWRPQIVVDAHEMSPNVEFYFDPATEPTAPFYPEYAARWHVRFGQAYAAAFDSAGFEFMTRERYNYFYPGYSTSYGSYQGAIGMLYEQGSTRGLTLTRADRSIRQLADALEQQFLAALTAVRTASAERATLLSEYYDALRAAVADGRDGTRRYLIAPEGDPSLVAGLANMLLGNAIEVDVLTQAARLGNVRDRTGQSLGAREFPAGTFVIDAAQPLNRLVRMLLEPDVPLPDDFLRRARERVERDENPRFYDITAWSLPLLFDVGGYSTSDGRAIPVERLSAPVAPPGDDPGRARYAYLLDGRQAASLAALVALKVGGYRASVIVRATRIGGRDVAGGTVIVRTGQNDESVHAAVREAAANFGLGVRAVDTGLSEPGFPSLGSGDHTFPVIKPEIAILAEDPIQGYSFGWAWFTLDRQYEISTTVLRVRSIAETPLDRFNVLVIPSTSGEALAAALGEDGVERIKRWVKEGGTLVTIAGATDFAREQLELIALRSWYDEHEDEAEDGPGPQRFVVPGAMLKGELAPHYWLSAGYDDGSLPVLVTSSRIYLAPEGPPSSARRIVGRYGSADDLKLSGHAWPESLERMPGTVFAYEERIEGGRVIAFAEDLNFRGYWRGANRLFLNAVVLGPSAP